MDSVTLARSRTATGPPSPSEGGFREEATGVMSGLTRALSDVIAAIPGQTRRAVDIERALGIDAFLAWQVFRVVSSSSPLGSVAHVPGPTAMERFLAAAGERGLDATAIEGAREAYAGLDDLIKRHCGDRASFETMINGIGGGEDAKLTLKHKRSMYGAAKHLWGVHASAIIKCLMFHLGEDDQLELAYVRVYAGVRRLRANAPYTLKLDTWQTIDAENGTGLVVPSKVHEPIDPGAADEHGVGLLADFCSRPLPEIHARQEESGILRVQVVGQSVGNSSASTCAVGEVSRKLTAWPIPGDDEPGLASRLWIETPAEAAISDILMPIGWSDRSTPSVVVYKHNAGPEGQAPGRHLDELPLAEEGVFAGVGPSAVRAPEFPQYPKLVEHVCERLGWDAERFDVYRCRVKFPILNTVLSMRVATGGEG